MNRKRSNLKNKPTNKFTVPRRATWYVLRTILLITIVVSMTFYVFLTAMHTANIYIIVTEGITLRAKCILGQGEITEMQQYFTNTCIAEDSALQDNVYDNYNISGFDYRLSVDKIDVKPWKKTASMTVTERIPTINGTAYESAPSSAIPEWEDVQYKVICMKENNRWYITKITVSDEKIKEKPKATPNMSLTPITPKPTEKPSPVVTQRPKDDSVSSETGNNP